MKKGISFTGKGKNADIGAISINRILPNRYAEAVGPFVFLDHIVPKEYLTLNKGSLGAHAHRGIATLTYVISGEDEHFDSAGNHATVHSGGVQWMKAGNGVVHDENLNCDTASNSKLLHGFQFWINLPATIKGTPPEYLAIQADEVPQKAFTDGGGWIRAIAGNYEDLQSRIPQYSEQFLYHIHLEAGKETTITIADKIEVAAFTATGAATINDSELETGEFAEFDRVAGTISITNKSEDAVDLLLFGGETYTEPIVAHGPFVMNTDQEIAEAYRDYHTGKYGEIDFDKE